MMREGPCTTRFAASAFGIAPNNSTQPSTCTQTVLNTVNNQFGTNAQLSNATSEGLQPGGQINVNIQLSGLTAAQFNAVQPGRYAPPGFFGFITGYGTSLHIVGGPSGDDPNVLPFNNQNIGGPYSVSFTAHLDSAWADNPIGALLHFIIDVLGHNSRKPC